MSALWEAMDHDSYVQISQDEAIDIHKRNLTARECPCSLKHALPQAQSSGQIAMFYEKHFGSSRSYLCWDVHPQWEQSDCNAMPVLCRVETCPCMCP